MNIGFVGGGNMATALIGGLQRAASHPHRIAVLEIDSDRAQQLQQRHGVEAHTTAGRWLASCDVVVLAVKPQQLAAAAASIRPHLSKPLIVSIAAGVRARTIAQWLGTDVIVRTMPNTPALIGAGITAAVALPGVSTEQRGVAEQILRAVGDVVWLDDEALLDPVTAVSGSGPAYVFLFIEALQQAAQQLGLTSAQGRQLAVQTFAGAAQLAAASDEPVAALRERVTSKGGTTAAALAALAAADVHGAIIRAVHAASARAKEMGDELDRQ